MKRLQSDLVGLSSDLEDLLSFLGVGAEGFFDEDVFASSHGFDGPF